MLLCCFLVLLLHTFFFFLFKHFMYVFIFIRDYKYFNDVHVFDLETYKWCNIEPVGKIPSPRSGFLMAALLDGRILVYGGYSREKVKKDVDKGIAHTDMYYLHVDGNSI